MEERGDEKEEQKVFYLPQFSSKFCDIGHAGIL
jgi:hypothetical protein